MENNDYFLDERKGSMSSERHLLYKVEVKSKFPEPVLFGDSPVGLKWQPLPYAEIEEHFKKRERAHDFFDYEVAESLKWWALSKSSFIDVQIVEYEYKIVQQCDFVQIVKANQDRSKNNEN